MAHNEDHHSSDHGEDDPEDHLGEEGLQGWRGRMLLSMHCAIGGLEAPFGNAKARGATPPHLQNGVPCDSSDGLSQP